MKCSRRRRLSHSFPTHINQSPLPTTDVINRKTVTTGYEQYKLRVARRLAARSCVSLTVQSTVTASLLVNIVNCPAVEQHWTQLDKQTTLTNTTCSAAARKHHSLLWQNAMKCQSDKCKLLSDTEAIALFSSVGKFHSIYFFPYCCCKPGFRPVVRQIAMPVILACWVILVTYLVPQLLSWSLSHDAQDCISSVRHTGRVAQGVCLCDLVVLACLMTWR